MPSIDLPRDSVIESYALTGEPVPPQRRSAAEFPRVAYAAGHWSPIRWPTSTPG